MKTKIDLGKAFMMPFEKEENLTRALGLFGIYLITILPMLLLMGLLEVDLPFMAQMSETSEMAIGMGTFLLTFVVVIPVALYVSGYMVQLQRELIAGKEEFPKHDMSYMGIGLKNLGISLVLGLQLFGIVILFALVGGLLSLFFTVVFAPLMILVGIAAIVLYFVLLFILATIIVPASQYMLVVKDSFNDAISLKKLFLFGKEYIGGFALVIGIFIAMNIGTTILSMGLSFIPYVGPIFTYALSFFLQFVIIILYGDQFRQIKEIEDGTADTSDVRDQKVKTDFDSSFTSYKAKEEADTSYKSDEESK